MTPAGATYLIYLTTLFPHKAGGRKTGETSRCLCLRVLMVLQHSPDYYGLPVNPEVSLGTSIWQYLLKPLGGIAAIGLIGGLVYNYTSNKREMSGKDNA